LQLQLSFGEPLAAFSAILSAKLVGVAGMPVTWQGTDFEFVPRDGGALISGVVTPGCSSVYSISTFLGILGLMYLDFRKSLSSTVKLAVVGVVSLALLNALRIAALIWVGYDIGEGALLSLHNWLGYGIFLGFYLVALSVYAGMKSAGKGNVGIGAPR
jgi:exosortase/archaeosortase family protein